MISIGKVRSVDYYQREIVSGREDYYVDAREAAGKWTGSLAHQLGLHGPVEADDLREAFEGRHPGDGEPLSATRSSMPGFDLTLSVPKSYSVLWALGGPEDARAVEAAIGVAQQDVERYLESTACFVRRGHGGEHVQPGGGFVGATFLHRTSRAGDPGLHVHWVILNVTEGPDGRRTALDGRALFRQRYTAEAIFQARLRFELARSVGVLFDEVDRHGVGEVADFPKPLRRAFSQRRVQIEREMAERGVTRGRGAQIATLATRPSKEPVAVTETELRQRWHDRARDHGFDHTQLFGTRMPRTPSRRIDDADLAMAVTAHQAYFERNAVIRAVANQASQGATLHDIEQRAHAFLSSNEAVAIDPGQVWTTREILQLEQRSIDNALSGRAQGRAVVDPSEALASRPSLSAEQQRMVQHLTTSGNTVDVIVGRAGSGKTFALDAVRDAYEHHGYRLVGTALSARAAKELQAGSGINAQTVASLQAALDRGRARLDDRTVLVIDEAAMVGTRQLAALLAEAHRTNAKVIAVGDHHQLPEIDAGGLFRALVERSDTVSLVDNRRQRDPIERAALTDLRHGNIDAALGRFARHGNITLGDNADQLRDQLIADWADHRGGGADVIMAALRRSDIADLNARAQQRLRNDGRLGRPVLTVDDTTFHVGDQVQTHRNRYDLGVLNGEIATVIGADHTGLHVHIDAQRPHLRLPLDYLESGQLTLGYATTVHKAQGRTCDVALLLGDDGLFRELGYTGLSRGRERNQLYLVANRDLFDSTERAPDPLAHLRSALSHSQAQTAATDYHARTKGR